VRAELDGMLPKTPVTAGDVTAAASTSRDFDVAAQVGEETR
jgi:hypothetical protein